MNDDVIDLGVLHDRMVEGIKRHFGADVAEVATYKRYEKGMPSPLIVVNLDASPDEVPSDAGTSELICGLDFTAYVVLDGLDAMAELKVRQLAMRLKTFLNRNNFGMPVCWPKVGQAADAEFEWPKTLRHSGEYVAWKVEFAYSGVVLGTNCWEGM